MDQVLGDSLADNTSWTHFWHRGSLVLMSNRSRLDLRISITRCCAVSMVAAMGGIEPGEDRYFVHQHLDGELDSKSLDRG